MQQKWGCQLVVVGMHEVGNDLRGLLGWSCEGRMCYHEPLSLQYPAEHWTADDYLHRLMPVWNLCSVWDFSEVGKTRAVVLQDQPASEVQELLLLFYALLKEISDINFCL
jgi:hypothetical protein